MGYLHISNLYKDNKIQLFSRCYALEKIHGTSAHIKWSGGKVVFFSGGEKSANFVALFDENALTEKFKEHPALDEIVVFGEAYGGKQQAQSWRYGKELKFVAFDVKIGDHWLDVPSAERFVKGFGLEFVYYKEVSTDLASLDAERDAPSEQAKRNGIEGDQPREGVVLRPLIEMRTSAEKRVISKHKRAEESEIREPKVPLTEEELKTQAGVGQIVDTWVTPVRLEHILDKLKVDGADVEIDRMGEVIKAMIEDVYREGKGEFEESVSLRKGIGNRTVKMFKQRCSLRLANRLDLWSGIIVK
jgi:hypothetical protein